MNIKKMLIDGNSIAYAAFFATEFSYEGRSTQVPYNFLNSLRSLLTIFKGVSPFVIWDSRAQFRRDIYPDYKANRVDTAEKRQQREDFKAQAAQLRDALGYLAIPQLTAPGFEADDLAYQISQSTQEALMLVTGDRDWLQMMTRPNISWFEHRRPAARDGDFRTRHVFQNQFSQETGLDTPAQFLEFKALTGDISDNITGVGGIGEKTALDVIKTHGSLERFVEWGKKQNKLPKALARFVNNEPFEYRGKVYAPPQKIFHRNLMLVDLARAPRIDRASIDVDQGFYSEFNFANFCQSMGYASILGELESWITPFRHRINSRKS